MNLIYALILSILSNFMLNAQITKKSQTELDYLVKEYNELFAKSNDFNNQLLFENNNKPLNSWNQLLFDNELYQNESGSENEFKFKRKGFFNYGFVWMSDATHNFKTGISDNEDVYFRSRFATGLDWILLGDGSYFKSRKRNDVFNIEIKKDSIEFGLQTEKVTLQKKQELIKYVFDKNRLEILKKYQDLLIQKVAYYEKLHKAKLNIFASKLKVDNELFRITNLINLTESYLSVNFNEQINKQYLNLPFDFDELPNLNTIREDLLLNNQKILNELQKEILLKNNINTSSPSLRTKVRYNYYNSDDKSSRGFASVGVSLSVPLQSNKNEELIKYKAESFDAKLTYQRNLLVNELSSKHLEFYVLKNRLSENERQMSYLQALLDNEIEIFKKGEKNFSPEKYINYTADLFDKRLERLDIKEQLCEKYMTFNYLIEENSKNNIKENFSKQKQNINIDQQLKAAYLWKKFFNQISNQDLISLLKINRINRLFLSPGEDDLKLKNFINLADDNQIQVERLIGENSYASSEDGVDKLFVKLESIKEFNFSGVHLDIEPHTLKDYKDNKQKYIDRMNQIYLMSKKWSLDNNMKLSVSIPMNLPIENAAFLAVNNMEAYIMAYENTDQTKLLKRTEELRKILKNNFVWVLRLSDFKSDEELKIAISTLNKNGIINIAYYDVSMLSKN